MGDSKGRASSGTKVSKGANPAGAPRNQGARTPASGGAPRAGGRAPGFVKRVLTRVGNALRPNFSGAKVK